MIYFLFTKNFNVYFLYLIFASLGLNKYFKPFFNLLCCLFSNEFYDYCVSSYPTDYYTNDNLSTYYIKI